MNCGCGCGEESKRIPSRTRQEAQSEAGKKLGGLQNLERHVNQAEQVAEGSQPLTSLAMLIQAISKSAHP